jgi:hypothetical protein
MGGRGSRLRKPPGFPLVVSGNEGVLMSRPPRSTPHSDIDGIHEDEERNVDRAIASGQGTKELAEAKKKSTGRPPYSDDVESEDDRTD